MSKINKKPGWSRYVKPFPPVKPIEPKKETIRQTFLKFASHKSWDGDIIRLSDYVSKLPAGTQLEDIAIEISQQWGYAEDGWQAEVSFGTYNNEILVNQHYEEQLQHYNKQLEEYKKKKKNIIKI